MFLGDAAECEQCEVSGPLETQHGVGEAADITGWLGGYNFQWAWSSGWAAGQVC